MIPPMFFEDGSHTFKSPGLSDGGLACTECPEGTGVSGPLGLSDRGGGAWYCVHRVLFNNTYIGMQV